MRLPLALLLLATSVTCYASETGLNDRQCTHIYLSVHNAGGRLTTGEATEFLNAIRCDYFSTAEGGEFGNELIMAVLEHSPEAFIAAFDTLPPSLQDKILGEVEAPVHDGFDLHLIYRHVTRAATTSPAKSRILSSIELAAKRLGYDFN